VERADAVARQRSYDGGVGGALNEALEQHGEVGVDEVDGVNGVDVVDEVDEVDVVDVVDVNGSCNPRNSLGNIH